MTERNSERKTGKTERGSLAMSRRRQWSLDTPWLLIDVALVAFAAIIGWLVFS